MLLATSNSLSEALHARRATTGGALGRPNLSDPVSSGPSIVSRSASRRSTRESQKQPRAHILNILLPDQEGSHDAPLKGTPRSPPGSPKHWVGSCYAWWCTARAVTDPAFFSCSTGPATPLEARIRRPAAAGLRNDVCFGARVHHCLLRPQAANAQGSPSACMRA